MIVFDPQAKPRVEDYAVASIDLLPTVVAYAAPQPPRASTACRYAT